MSYEPARPRYTLPFAGKEYDLIGTFGMIEAVEYAMKEHIGKVVFRLVKGVLSGDESEGMPTGDLAKLLAAILTSCGFPKSTKEVGEYFYQTAGLIGGEIATLRLHLYSFLCISLAPPGKREQRAKELGELLGGLTTASPGDSTDKSA